MCQNSRKGVGRHLDSHTHTHSRTRIALVTNSIPTKCELQILDNEYMNIHSTTEKPFHLSAWLEMFLRDSGEKYPHAGMLDEFLEVAWPVEVMPAAKVCNTAG